MSLWMLEWGIFLFLSVSLSGMAKFAALSLLSLALSRGIRSQVSEWKYLLYQIFALYSCNKISFPSWCMVFGNSKVTSTVSVNSWDKLRSDRNFVVDCWENRELECFKCSIIFRQHLELLHCNKFNCNQACSLVDHKEFSVMVLYQISAECISS
jgi:hypothetical protein